MTRMHDPQNPFPKGLPRPLAHHPGYDRPLPVPHSQDVDGNGSPSWGVLRTRNLNVKFSALCLICGLTVNDGVVLLHAKTAWTSDLLTEESIRRADVNVADNAPMHNRCCKLAKAHCQTLRERLAHGLLTEFAYQRKLDKPTSTS